MRLKRKTKIHKRNGLNKYVFIFTAIALILAILFGLRIISFFQTITIEDTNNKDTDTTIQEQKEFNFLLMGYGGGKHEGTFLTDTLIVAHVKIDQQKIFLISIPRDTWVKVPTLNSSDFYSKINALYQIGKNPKNYKDIDSRFIANDNHTGLLKNAITNITGLEIDGFLSIDFNGFVSAIDTLEGIDILVEKSFTDYEYPIEANMNDLCGRDEEFAKIEPIINKQFTSEQEIEFFDANPELKTFYDDIKKRPSLAFPCRYEVLAFKKGVNTMDGDMALKFARSRHSLDDGGDFNRARRQQLVINAILDKIVTVNFIPKILPLLSDLQDNIRTDIPLSQINKFLQLAGKSSQISLKSFIITDKYLVDDFSQHGGSILISKNGIDNWEVLQNDLHNFILEVTPTPTQLPLSPTVNR